MADKVKVYPRGKAPYDAQKPTLGEYVMPEMRFRVMVMDCLYEYDRGRATPTVDDVLRYCKHCFRVYCRVRAHAN